ncbi:alpha-L RNA-binding motif-containing protein [Aureobasidium sp. EXF-3400]|nr:alpha-L RNA-binding motif-containing protein [Aureobasidium sp. EXF-12344]KAI4768990.1 alpha-L RNA-binding motif-containing protein [Aureobasidium sp. EXF-3400]
MRKRFHGLKKPKVRADWSKWTLYNISRLQTPPARSKTFFQQKWLAKSLTRAYHGEQIREGKWTRMFDRRLPAVVPMDYKLLARTDGSEQAQGRGSGLNITIKKDDSDGEQRESKPQRTPYMHMTYFPTERRLDTAVWRALFASSARQARQFVVHGSVKVNGKKMVHPGYLLNPGDMFSVDPERVLYATGARKHNKNTPDTLQGREEPEQVEQIVDEDAEDVSEESEAKDAAKAAAKAAKTIPSADEDPKAALKSLLARAQDITKESKEGLSGKRKQDLRAFAKSVKQTMSRLRPSGLMKPGTETIDTLEETLKAIAAKVPVEDAPAEAALPDQQQKPVKREDAFRARKDAELLHAALARANENPIDASKPYATPWRPREFMSAFAFIPRYLEVNQKICSAVYLRHPVARPGLAEVPTPFANETMALAFNWYLRRR